MKTCLLSLLVLGCVSACGDDTKSANTADSVVASDSQVSFDTTADTDGSIDTATDPDTTVEDTAADTVAPDAVSILDGCGRAIRGADDPRVVVFARPYEDSAAKASTFGTGVLAADGTLTLNEETFDLGRATTGTFAFARDGAVAAIHQEDGSVGIIRIDDGVVTPVTSYTGEALYASGVAEDPTGNGVYILDVNWPNNGGGLFHLSLACDGTPSDERLVIQSKNLRAMAWIDRSAGIALVDSVDFLGGDVIGDVHRLAVSSSQVGTTLESLNAFDADPIVTAIAVTPSSVGGNRLALVSENSAFSGVPNRVVAVRLPDSGEPMTVAQTLRGISDPFNMVLSPDGKTAMILSGDGGNRLIPVALDPSADNPLVEGVPLASPLPGDAVVIARGALTGHVIVTQVTGLRQVAFAPDGSLVDLGLVEISQTLSGLPGALGVQP